MRTLSAIALWCLLSTTVHAGWWSLGTNLNATITPCSCRPYNGTDARGVDSYLLWAYRTDQPCNTWGSNSVVTPLVSPVTFQAGTPYYFWVKVLDYDDQKIGIHAGDGFLTNTVILTDNDFDDRYNRIGPITSSITSTNFGIECYLTNLSATSTKYLLLGIYVTTNANEAVPKQGDDLILTFDAPSSAETDIVTTGNFLPNSSFEVGALAQGWTMYDSSANGHSFDATNMWDSTTAAHGKYSLKSTGRVIVYSPYFRVPDANRLFSMSFYGKAESAALDQNRPEMTIQNIQLTNSAYGFASRTQTWTFTPTLTTNWSRFSLTSFPLWDYPDSYFQLRIHTHSKIAATNTTYPAINIDAIKIEQGNGAQSYSTITPIEVGIRCLNQANTFLTTDTKEVQIISWNNTSASSNLTCYYNIFDVQNRLVQSGTPTFTFPMGSGTNTIVLTFTNYGPYRMIFGAPESKADETTFCLLPPITPGTDTNSWIGVHSNPSTYSVQLHQRLGFTWLRGLSPASLFRWAAIQPTSSNSYTWGNLTNRVLNVTTNGMVLLASMNSGRTSGSDVPTWATALGNPPPVSYYSNWVNTVVNTYKHLIHHWEFWNEPQEAFSTDAGRTNYTSAFVDAVYAADPNAGIVIGGGVNGTNTIVPMVAALTPTQQGRVSEVSIHRYPPTDTLSTGPNPFTSSGLGQWQVWRDEAGQPITNIWNTESGVQPWGGYQKGQNSQFNLYGETDFALEREVRYIDAAFNFPDQLVYQAVRSVGLGMKFFHYDSRDSSDQSTGYNLTTTHTGLEAYEALKPHLYYMVALNEKTRGMTPGYYQFLNTADSDVEFYWMSNGGTNLVMILNTDYQDRFLTLAETNFVQYDAEWNPVTRSPLSRVDLTRRPAYLWTTALSTNAIITALKNATVTSVSDTTAPAISIDWTPFGQISANDHVTLKWFAQDNVYIPNLTGDGMTNVVFRTKLTGRDSDYGDWGQETLELFQATTLTTNVLYSLSVQAQDASGNSSTFVGPEFYLSTPSGGGGGTNDGGGIIITGQVRLRGVINLRTL